MLDIPTTEDDFRQIALLHKNVLRDSGFLSSCSVDFITYFYQTLARISTVFLGVNRAENGRVAGFIFCSLPAPGYYREFFKSAGWRIGLFPSTFLPLVQAFLRRNDRSEVKHPELVQIAIDPVYQGKGISRELILGGEEYFLRNGCSEYVLQVFATNKAALRVYQREQFTTIATLHTRRGTKYLMQKKLTTPPTSLPA